MKLPTKIIFAGKLWDVIPLACGYMWRLKSGDKQFPVNLDELLQMDGTWEMKEFKGTPGKWDVGMDGDILSDAGYIVMSTVLVHGNDSDRDLISAAPELLDALQDALHAHDNHGEHSEWDFARAAIAKALGESQ